MKWAALLVVFLVGCSAHTQLRVGSGTVSNAPPGTSITQSAVQLRVEGGRGLATLLGLSILAAGIYDMERDGVRYRGNPFMTLSDNSPQFAAELAPERRVVEQDCSRPLVDPSANLRCR